MQVDDDTYDKKERAEDALMLWGVEAGVFGLVLGMYFGLVMEVLCVLCVLLAGVLGAVPGVSAERRLPSQVLLVLYKNRLYCVNF